MEVIDRARVRLLSIVGTRPEAIKIAPVALAAAERAGLSHDILATGQHDALFDDALAGFGLTADYRLAPLPRDPSPDVMTERLAQALAPVILSHAPDMVLVQGDTTSAYAAALAAHHLGIPIGHIEAGLRSHDMTQPWPEERNRVMIDRLAELLFAPTAQAAANLRRESMATGHIVVTGNTGIDALMIVRNSLPSPSPVHDDDRARILLTCHRRENIGAGLEGVCAAALRLADRGDVSILIPVHPNSAVRETICAKLGLHPAIRLVDPLSYRDNVEAMAASRLILTDSGGIQEEAPTLGIPTLILRDVTERQEGLASGNLLLVGTDPDRICVAAAQLLDQPTFHTKMARPAFPFGLPGAAEKILDVIEQYFSQGPGHELPLPFMLDWTKHGAPKGA